MSVDTIVPDRLKHTGIRILQCFHDDPGPLELRRPRLLRSIAGLPYCTNIDNLKESILRYAHPTLIKMHEDELIIICQASQTTKMKKFIREGVHTMSNNIEYGIQYPTYITIQEVRDICQLSPDYEPTDDTYSSEEDEQLINELYSIFTIGFTTY